MDHDLTRLLLPGAAWLAWGGLHSLLASHMVKERARAWLGEAYRGWRLGFNAVAGTSFLLAAGLTLVLRGDLIWSWGGAWRPVQLLLLAGAGALFLAGARGYDMGAFLGLRQLLGEDRGERPTLGFLRTRGIHAYTRHPWYLGTFLLLWALPLDLARLSSVVVLSAYLVVGTLLEERKLRAELGADWEAYTRRVPMFLGRPRA